MSFFLSQLSTTSATRALISYNDNIDNLWSEYILSEQSALLASVGFEDSTISFSGFSCQGDGASFISEYVDVPAIVKNLSKINKILRASYTVDLFANSILEQAIDLGCIEFGVSMNRSNPHYCHENTVSFEWDVNYIEGNREFLNDYIDDCLMELLESIRTDFCKKFYSELESAYDYETSMGSFIETCDSMSYEFDIDGDIV